VKIERSSDFNECSSECHVKIDQTFFLRLFEVCLAFGRAKSFKLQFSIELCKQLNLKILTITNIYQLLLTLFGVSHSSLVTFQ